MAEQRVFSRFLDTNGDGTGTINAIGNYSSSATDFYIKSDGKRYNISRMIVTAEDANGMTASEYGNLGSALTNGIRVLLLDVDGNVSEDLAPIPVKTNAQWAMYCYDANVLGWGNGDDLLAVRWTFVKAGEPLEIGPGVGEKSFVVRLNDDFSGLVSHRFLIEGTY